MKMVKTSGSWWVLILVHIWNAILAWKFEVGSILSWARRRCGIVMWILVRFCGFLWHRTRRMRGRFGKHRTRGRWSWTMKVWCDGEHVAHVVGVLSIFVQFCGFLWHWTRRPRGSRGRLKSQEYRILTICLHYVHIFRAGWSDFSWVLEKSLINS